MQQLSILILGSAIIHIIADSMRIKKVCVVTKPLTLLLIILLLVSTPNFYDSPLRVSILVGLLFSLAGDIFLLWPETKFIAGLLSFFIAHVVYTYGFWCQNGKLSTIPLVLLVPFSLGFISLLWRNLGGMRLPVLLYMGIIALMTLSASSWFYYSPALPSFYAALGATLFVISDSCLAWHKFRGPYALSSLCIMATYYSAQWLIVLSAR